MRNRKFIKNSKKLEKYSYGFFLSKNWLETAENERKSKLLFRFVPTQRLVENYQQIAKKFIKFEEYHLASFQAKIG